MPDVAVAALKATADEVNGVPHLVFLTGAPNVDTESDDHALAESDADFIVSYVSDIDAAIETTNDQTQ